MIKFEKDNYIMYFEDADAAAEWLVKEWGTDGNFANILENEFYTFGYWLNDHYNALDILIMKYTYEELYKEYMEDLAYDIHHNYIEYFYNENPEVD